MPSACQSGMYSPPGSNNSESCVPGVFLKVSISFPMDKSQFSLVVSQFISALAAAARVESNTIIVDGVYQISFARAISVPRLSRSGNISEISIDSRIFAGNMANAISIRKWLKQSEVDFQMKKIGLPTGKLTLLEIISISQVNSGFWGQNVAVMLGVLVSCVVVLLIAFVLLRRSKDLPADEKLIKSTVYNLRKKFKMERKNGFYLNTERLPLWGYSDFITLIKLNQLEAAARIELYQDFDLNAFDALCTPLDVFAYNANDGRNGFKAHQFQIVSTWILKITRGLFDPASTQLSLAILRSAKERDEYFRKLMKANIWLQYNGAAFLELKKIAKQVMDQIEIKCDERYEAIVKEDAEGGLVRMPSWPLPIEERGNDASTRKEDMQKNVQIR